MIDESLQIAIERSGRLNTEFYWQVIDRHALRGYGRITDGNAATLIAAFLEASESAKAITKKITADNAAPSPTCERCDAQLGYAEVHDGDNVCDKCHRELGHRCA